MMHPGNDAVRERAYRIWEAEGRPYGRDLAHWLQAEREIATPTEPAMAETANSALQRAKRAVSSGARKRKTGI